MATAETLKPASNTSGSEVAPAPLDRFDALCQRLRGTVIIHGDIVSADPEMSVADDEF